MKKGQKGFTLIELLIVVAILGVLAAIAIPRFAGIGTDEAKDAVDKANVRALQSAVELWNFKHPGTDAITNSFEVDATENDATVSFVPNYVKEIPESPTGGTYTVEDGVVKLTPATPPAQ